MAKLVVVGGGAAGMVAAWRAAGLGHRVTLLEANARLGVKLRISGGGKCNITHAGSVAELLGVFQKEQARFLRPAMHRFCNAEILAMLDREGVETYTRDNGRVFPLDRPGSSAAVVGAFERLVREAGVRVLLGTRVLGLEGRAPRLEALRLTTGERFEADGFILATGGASYPETGTKGEVLGWLRELGLPVSPWFPALAPIPLVRPRPEWEGVALRGGGLHLHAGDGGKRLASFAGDILFAKAGITGPAALELSQAAEAARREGGAWLNYALTATPWELVDAEAQEDQRRHPQMAVSNWLQRWLPERMCDPVLGEQGVPMGQRLKDLNRIHRKALVRMITGFPLGEPRAVPLERGEVAAGGVRLQAVDPRTMLAKGWENLRLCGELLNIDGPVGGYNLQAAFSTGFMAGDWT